MTKTQYEKEHAEFIEKQKKEMESQFKNFMEEWMASMSKESPEVIEQVKEGAQNLINSGKSKDRVWELLCCASKAHKANVETIEKLKQANDLLSTENDSLQKERRAYDGFDDITTRMGKRPRANDDTASMDQSDPRSARNDTNEERVPTSDVWGQFEQFMSTTQSRAMY